MTAQPASVRNATIEWHAKHRVQGMPPEIRSKHELPPDGKIA
ncbi:hypothetical protein [Pseudooceanicola sp.]|nr:hypothetical protein [Pseudooceanicola sp.]MDF1855057.1 hypothetical protein [Pseudooceanicola sp.]